MSQRILVISGMSGAGKSSALHALEDAGFYCVDNLPPALIDTFVDLAQRPGTEVDRVAVAVDVRTGGFLDGFGDVWTKVRAQEPSATLLFFDADDPTLMQRFSETRRPHPVTPDASVAESIAAERELLARVRELADDVIDTSQYTVWGLRDFLLGHFGEQEDPSLRIRLTSFGFRRGVPPNADLVFDIRFLPNPYYDKELRELTGLDPAVREFVESQAATRDFLDHLEGLLAFLLPAYAAEGKTYLTIAFGCTGGRHRSVAMACMVDEMLQRQGYATKVAHTDIPEGRESRRRA